MGRLLVWPLGIIGVILIILAACGVINAPIRVMMDVCLPAIVLSIIAIFCPD